MKVNAAIASYFPTIPRNQEVASSKTPPVSASDKASNTPSDESGIKRADFTNMTRKEMWDWMNDQLRSGKMSGDDSSTFFTMTAEFSGLMIKPVDATDTERINYMERARQGVKYSLSRDDQVGARYYQAALDIMTKNQGLATGVNTTA